MKPLAGRRIAVTRGGGVDDALSRRLLELGAEVLEAPAIAFAPPTSWEALDAALRGLVGMDWIAFASARAVEHTVARAASIGLDRSELQRPRLAVVGTATARAAATLLREPDLVPAEARAEALAAAMAPEVKGRWVLAPRAEQGRPELVNGLVAAGAAVEAPAAYRTLPASAESLAPLVAAVEEDAVDAVTFASPSAVRSVLAALGERAGLLRRTVLAAIGPTTAAELGAAGFTAAVQPASASGPALAEALARWLLGEGR
jgi:uroporphyrinogen-III synthase